MKKKLYENKNWLQQKYTVEKKSTPEIGKILNCNPGTIRNWLIKLNIQIRAHFRPLEERFWEKVNKNGLNGCWIWTWSLMKGYGRIEIEGKTKRAHVVSWEWYKGRKVKDGYILHHECKHKNCVNPMHLQEMTEAKHDKHHSKLTEKIVLEIRADWATGKYTQKELAKKYDVSISTISNIVNRKTWKHI